MREITQADQRQDAMLTALTGLGQTVDRPPNEFYETIKELFNEEKLDFITELTPNQVRLLTKLVVIHSWTHNNSKMIPVVFETFKRLMVSSNRGGRRELIDAVKPQSHVAMQEEQQGFFGRLFRPRGR